MTTWHPFSNQVHLSCSEWVQEQSAAQAEYVLQGYMRCNTLEHAWKGLAVLVGLREQTGCWKVVWAALLMGKKQDIVTRKGRCMFPVHLWPREGCCAWGLWANWPAMFSSYFSLCCFGFTMLNERSAINTTLGCTSWSITFLFNSFQCPNEEAVDSD